MTNTSPYSQIKEASLKVLENRRTPRTIYSERIDLDDVLSDKSNREEMLINHTFIEAYTNEYKYIQGIQKPNYTRVTSNYYSSLDGFFLDDLDEVVSAGYMRQNRFYYTGDWANPDAEDSEFSRDPKNDVEYVSWQADNEKYQYFPQNEALILSGINFLAPLIEKGKINNYVGKIEQYVPYAAVGIPRAVATTITVNAPPQRRRGAKRPINEEGDYDLPDYEGTTSQTITTYSNPFEMKYDEKDDQSFAVSDYVLVYTSKKRTDLFDKHSLTITNKCTVNGNLQISIRSGERIKNTVPDPMDPENGTITTITLNNFTYVPVTTSMNTPELVAAAIRATGFKGYTTSGTGATIIFTCTTSGSKIGEVSFDPLSTGVTGTLLKEITTTSISTLDAETKETKILGKILTLAMVPTPKVEEEPVIEPEEKISRADFIADRRGALE